MQAFGQDIPMQVVASAGGYYSSANLSVSWTVGEPVISTLTSANVILTQGFQQGNLFGTGIPINPNLNSFSLKMFPNPAINKVYFDVNNLKVKGAFIVAVYDITGRSIITQNLGQYDNQEQMELSVSFLKSGLYLVKVRIGNFNSDVIKFVKE